MFFGKLPKSPATANPNISITVFAWNGNSVYPWRQSSKRAKTVILFLITDEEKSHYTWVKNLSKLLSSQINSNEHAKQFCLNCSQAFKTEKSLKKHQDWCLTNEGVIMTFPKIENKIKFNSNYHCRSMRVPFVVYADFECFTKPIQGCQPNSQESYANQYQQHEPSGFGYYVVSVTGECEYKSYTKQNENENIGDKFIRSLEETIKNLYNKQVS